MLTECLGQLGKGTLDLHDDWLTPFTIQSGAVALPETNVPLHYRRQFFGDDKKGAKTEATFDYFPPRILEKLEQQAWFLSAETRTPQHR